MDNGTTNWHAISNIDLFQKLRTSDSGLTTDEVTRRQAQYGLNTLPEKGATPFWLIIARQFASPLIYILVAAAVVSIIVGDAQDAIFIGVVLILNAAIGAYQEWHAEKSSAALKKLLRIRAKVVREGSVHDLPANEIVPGDVVWLESGNRVPADLRLIWANNLAIDESLLTGESVAVSKNPLWIGNGPEVVGDRKNMAFAGSIIPRGRAKGIVVSIGEQTMLGQMAKDMASEEEGKPPLIARMETFTNRIAIGTVVAAVVIGALGVVVHGNTILDTIFFVIALAVSAIPEGLPVAMTVALAVATTRMAKRRVIVRRLAAVEGLGSCTLIATDKTGTLTCNELTCKEIVLTDGRTVSVTGEGYEPNGEIQLSGESIQYGRVKAIDELLKVVVLSYEGELSNQSGTWEFSGDAVDIALLSLGEKGKCPRQDLTQLYRLVEEIPFESENQFSATEREANGTFFVAVKGAPERLFSFCSSLTDTQLKSLENSIQNLARRGFRVIGVASKEYDRPVTLAVDNMPSDLIFHGLIAMIDPLRPEVRHAFVKCREAGVEVKMVTGDHRTTALAIAQDLGLAHSEHEVITGDEFNFLSGEEIRNRLRKVKVFARVSPRQKLQIVEGARKSGEFVAVTGDGANDAPAMRASNIGVAMGKGGTDVARESAELVLSDDNFTSIVNGIEEGRIAYDNIRKVIFLLVSMGAAELLMVLLSVLTGLPVPLLPVQLLWLNLVTNGMLGVAMAFEPGDGSVLKRPPRPPQEPIFNRLMLERLILSALFVGFGGFLAYWLAIALRPQEVSVETQLPFARNFLLLIMVVFELVHVGNCRSESRSAFAFSPLRNPALLFATVGAFLVHVVGMYVPFLRNVLETSPVSLNEWIIALAVGALIVPVVDLHKVLCNRRGIR